MPENIRCLRKKRIVEIFLKAEISTPKIFSDNMVLQRGTPVNIWGKSEKNADVEIEFLGEKTAAKADGNGNWKIALKPMDAVRTPGELKIYENGKLSKTITNVLVGEVWILGGQSNMEWVVNNTTDAENVKQRANYPIMRYFYQPGEAISETEQTDRASHERARYTHRIGKYILWRHGDAGMGSAFCNIKNPFLAKPIR